MPYWDFSSESNRNKTEEPYIFGQGLGGDGDPDNAYTVNGYSWDVATEDYWVPEHCVAEGDVYPYCSLKRAAKPEAQYLNAAETGKGIIANTQFTDFSRWYSDTFNVPHNIMTNVEFLLEPVITSYDPIWYIFHSMMTYHQSIWTDCQEYDQIAPKDLDEHPEAFTPFCDGGSISSCGNDDGINGQSLDSEMAFGGELPLKEWAFINSQPLTVRKSYHLSRWNVVYDLKGDTFFAASGLKDFCEGKLNDHWFVNAEEAVDGAAQEKDEDLVLNGGGDKLFSVRRFATTNQMLMVLVGAMFVCLLVSVTKMCRNKKETEFELWDGKEDYYGAVDSV